MSQRTSLLWPGRAFARLWSALHPIARHTSVLAVVACCTLGNASFAAEQTSITLDRPGAGETQLKKGDNVPDEFQRPSLAVNDWQARHLSAPGKDEQWVQIKGKFALVSIPTGTIKALIDKP